jgi:hypothetical protein
MASQYQEHDGGTRKNKKVKTGVTNAAQTAANEAMVPFNTMKEFANMPFREHVEKAVNDLNETFFKAFGETYDKHNPLGDKTKFYDPIYLTCEKLNLLCVLYEMRTIEGDTKDFQDNIFLSFLQAHKIYENDKTGQKHDDALLNHYLNYLETLTTENTTGYKKLIDIIESKKVSIGESSVDKTMYKSLKEGDYKDITFLKSARINPIEIFDKEYTNAVEFFKSINADSTIINRYLTSLSASLKQMNNTQSTLKDTYISYFDIKQKVVTNDEAKADERQGNHDDNVDDNLALEVAAAVAASESLPQGGGGAVRRRRRVMKPKN